MDLLAETTTTVLTSGAAPSVSVSALPIMPSPDKPASASRVCLSLLHPASQGSQQLSRAVPARRQRARSLQHQRSHSIYGAPKGSRSQRSRPHRRAPCTATRVSHTATCHYARPGRGCPIIKSGELFTTSVTRISHQAHALTTRIARTRKCHIQSPRLSK